MKSYTLLLRGVIKNLFTIYLPISRTFLLLTVLLVNNKSLSQNFWEQTNGPPGGRINSLAINSSGHIFAATNNLGVFRSTDNGANWLQRNNGIPTFWIRSLAINSSGHIFAGASFEDGVFRSTDNGESWVEKNNGLPFTSIYSLAINSSGHIFAGTIGQYVFRSTDNGENWVEINDGLMNNTAWALAINSSGHIFAGSNGEGVFRSTDNGESWVEINNGLQVHLHIYSLAINSSGHIFAGSVPDGIWRSNNNGEDWVEINNGLTGDYVRSLAINSSDHIFAGTNQGVFLSYNGVNWLQINSGFPGGYAYSLAINSDDYIFAGTDDDGVFRSVNSTPVKGENNSIPSTFSLSQNYPNPFNPTTKISWQSSVGSWQTLIVYDVLGNEIATLMDEYKPAGTYEVEFNVTQLPRAELSSGIYFYQLKAGNFVETKKMILIK